MTETNGSERGPRERPGLYGFVAGSWAGERSERSPLRTWGCRRNGRSYGWSSRYARGTTGVCPPKRWGYLNPTLRVRVGYGKRNEDESRTAVLSYSELSYLRCKQEVFASGAAAGAAPPGLTDSGHSSGPAASPPFPLFWAAAVASALWTFCEEGGRGLRDFSSRPATATWRC